MTHVLLINAHQHHEGISTGALNRSLLGVMETELRQRGCALQRTDIEAGYDSAQEVAKHLWADLIILQSPVYWFGAPWIHKKYVDEVFTAGMMQGAFLTGDGRSRDDASRPYGSGGLLQGKRYMLSLTWNAPAAAFGDAQHALFAGRSVDDVFVQNTANYQFCGMQIVPAFSCFDVLKAPAIAHDFERLRAHLAQWL